jgi:hypothetical protein
MSVPAYKLFELSGSITRALMGMLGMPLPAAVQTGATGEAPAAAVRFVIFQIH